MTDHYSSRPYQLYFEHRPDYLYAFVSSPTVDFKIARGYWVEILTMLDQRRYKKILLEKDIQQKLSAHDLFDLMSELSHSRCNTVTFGIYDHHYDAERCHFEQMLATNRGMNLKIDSDLCQLEKWLVEQPSHGSIGRSPFPIFSEITQPRTAGKH